MSEEKQFIKSLMEILKISPDAYITREPHGLLFLDYDLDEAVISIPLKEEYFNFIKPGQSFTIPYLMMLIREAEGVTYED